MSRKRSPTPIVVPVHEPQSGGELKEKILRGLSAAVLVGALACYAQLAGQAKKEVVDLRPVRNVALYTIVFLGVQWAVQTLTAPLGQSLITRKAGWSREVWRAKVDRFGAAVYKLAINVSGLVVGYYLMKGKDWLPSSLGGSGETKNLWKNLGRAEEERVVDFYLSCIGFVISDILTHVVWERKRPDFAELTLHLLVSFAFLTVAFMSDLIRVGLLVIFVHLVCDVFVYTAKAIVDTKLSGGAAAYLPLLFVHGYFRLYVFSKILRTVVVEAAHVLPKTWAPWGFLSVTLGLSLLMQAFWGFVIVKIGLLLLATGQSRDLQANLSAMDLRRKAKKH